MALALMLALIGAVSPAWAQDATAEVAPDVTVLVPHTEEGFGFETVVPDGWTSVGNGIYARQSSPTDTTVIAQQAAPLGAEALLNAILPQLALTTAPESVGTYAGQALEWTLYAIDVTVGATSIKVDLALAEDGGTTYLVLLQTSPEDYETLHAGVFLPTLDAFAVLAPEAEEPVPYTVEDVTFENGDVTLAGTLTLPPADGPHPVVVLVTGSGPQDRDEALGGGIAIKPFKLIADALTRAGIAVLRYDDRGIGESTGDFATATETDFAADAAAAIDYLLTRDDINPDEIGLLGHSEGGLIAAVLGASNPDLDFIITMAGPGVNGRDVLLVQNQRLMQAEGATQAQIDEQVAFVEDLLTLLDDPQAMETLMYERALAQIQSLPEEQQAALGDIETYARTSAAQAVQQYATGWFKGFVTYDPAPDWAQITVPVLALFGGKDVQVDAEQNAPAVEAALAEAGNEDYEIVVLPNANHLFQEAGTGGFSEYGALPAEFLPDFLPTILSWLQAHVTIAG
jgi:hypothetical protein